MSSKPSEDQLLIRKIRDGIVIDHIPASKALTVLRLLKITGKEGLRVALVMNVESRKIGVKDIIKIEGRELSRDELSIIALVAPTATINIIRDYRVVSKFKVEVPDSIEGALRCLNTRCITNKPNEPIRTKFVTISRNPLIIKCHYCGTYYTEEDIEKML